MSRPRPSHAGFCPKAGYAGLDRGLAPALAEYFVERRRGARPAPVGDFGAGRGWYSAYLNKVEGLAAAPYAYLLTAFAIVEKVMPMRKSWRRMGHVWPS